MEQLMNNFDNQPEEIKALLVKSFDERLYLSTAKVLAKDITNPNSQKLAGTIYLLSRLRGCPRDVDGYVEALFHRLSKKNKLFLLQNKTEFNQVLKENYNINFQRFDYLSATKMVESYLLTPGHKRDPLETPELAYLRMAIEMHSHFGIEKVLERYSEMSNWYYTPASPTIFNAGTPNNQMSSCFLVHIEDDLTSILQTGVGECGLISKAMGGLGIDVNSIRHSEIGYTGISSGMPSFVRVYDRNIGCVDQGGRRKGAGTVFARDWHVDILDFVKSCSSLAPHHERFDNVTSCVWMSNLFYERVEKDGWWTLFCPSHVPGLANLYNEEFEEKYLYYENLVDQQRQELQQIRDELSKLREKYISNPDDEEKRNEYFRQCRLEVEYQRKKIIYSRRIKASELYDLIVDTQLKKSVYMMNGDTINGRNQMANIGAINGSNLCLEIVEPANKDEIASCNLSSINLTKHCRGTVDYSFSREMMIDYDFDKEVTTEELRKIYDFNNLGKICRSVVDNLNQVIDFNNYPLDIVSESGIIRGKISKTNFRNRPIGIGVGGLSDTYLNLDLPYDSDGATLFNKMLFATMYFNSLVQSLKMAIEEGEYSTFRTGECRIFNPETHQFETLKGSPLSNGFFQFDLWYRYAESLKTRGMLYEQEEYDDGEVEVIYDRKDDIPLDPSEWGQLPITFSTHDYQGYPITVTVEPSWECLRQLIIRHGVRNSMLLALMPTASTSSLMNLTESTEAAQQLIYSRKVNDGNFTVIVPQLRDDLMKLGVWNQKMVDFIVGCRGTIRYIDRFVQDFPDDFPNFIYDWKRLSFLKRKFKTMFEISQKVVCQQARQRGIYVDQSQSMNIYLKNASEDQLKALHQYSRKCLLKTQIYYLRQVPDAESAQFTLSSEMRNYISRLDIDEKEGRCTDDGVCLLCSA